MSYRQLWRKAKNGEIPEAVQTEGGSWYLPPGARVPQERTTISPELEKRIRHELMNGDKPVVVARKEGVAVSTVYKIQKRYHAALREEDRQHQERAERLKRLEQQMPKGTPTEVVALHMRGGAAIRATDLAGADEKALGQFVRFEGYFDPSKNVFYANPEQVRAIVEWEDARQRRVEELYEDIAGDVGSGSVPE